MNYIVQRGIVKKLSELPEYSIALDGFVEGPEVDPEHHRFSFDHHAGCLRYCTTAACMQAWTAINLGLDPENYTVYANDVDSDVCVAIWCLKHPDRCQEPLVYKLVNAVSLGDMHNGSIPLNGMHKIVEWIAGPEVGSKRNQDYNKISDDGLVSILEAVLHRVDLYVDGEASIEVARQNHKHGDYKVLRDENGWTLVESNDSHINGVLYQAGYNRLVRISHLSDGSLAVSLAKRSEFIGEFPLERLYAAFNLIEPGWGGSKSCGGCVRNPDGSRSHLSLERIITTVDQVVMNLPKTL